MLDPRREHRHCPYFCEENVWQLALELGPSDHLVALVSNAARQVPVWAQRAAAAPDQAVLWDYHVLLLRPGADPLVLDLDSTLAFPTPLDDYLETAFAGHAGWSEPLQPRFRLVEATDYCARLWSDRSHMRDAAGTWLQPPPPWSPPLPGGEVWPLAQLLDLSRPDPGQVLGLPELRRALAAHR